MPRRTYRRTAKDGFVKADGRLWGVSLCGKAFSGVVLLKINSANDSAWLEHSPIHATRLELRLVETLHETQLPSYLSIQK